ncbi:MAG: SLC13 family permease [Bryobacteraceae bacterium]
MSPAALSLAALVAAIVLSCFAPVHVGVLSIASAFVIGHWAAGMKPAALAAGFPTSLFLTLTGVMLLFSMAAENGTLEKLAKRSLWLARGNRGMIPVVFFFLALVLGAIGPGGIAASALLAPVAMPVAAEAGIGAFLMTLMVANGANAGTFSPIAPTGVIARELMERIGLHGAEWQNFWNTLLAQSLVAFAGYFALGGLRLFREPAIESGAMATEPLDRRQRLTLAMIAALVVCVVALRTDVGFTAFTAAAALSLLRASDEEAAVRKIPWSVILLVCGVTMLIFVMEKTGGMDLFTGMLAKVSSPGYIPAVMALICGIISVYSSSSGVVMPAFLPTIPGLVAKLGGGNPLMIAYSVNVGAHLVDVSPLSTIGAICIACAPVTENRPALFRKLLVWGWSMALVGAVVCQILFGYR